MRKKLSTNFIIIFILFSCQNKENKEVVASIEPIAKTDTLQQSINQEENSTTKPASSIIDTFKRIEVDGYPITNDMLREQSNGESFIKKYSEDLSSFDHAWFRDEKSEQVLIIALATDYHRLATFHFYTKSIPKDLLEKMEIHKNGGQEIATVEEKAQNIQGFIKQSKVIDEKYLKSNKGIQLGCNIDRVKINYSNPNKTFIKDGFDILEWYFYGDQNYDLDKAKTEGKPLAESSFGYKIVVYVKNKKVVGYALHDEVP